MVNVGISKYMSHTLMSDTPISLKLDATADSEQEVKVIDTTISFWRRLRRLFWHTIARQVTLLCVVALKIARLIGRRCQPVSYNGCEILLTGRFDSKNWILNHLRPLAASQECSRIWMVSSNPIHHIPKVKVIYPPKWLTKIVGVTPARLLTFIWTAVQKRPHVIGGFSLTVNGIPAVITSRLVGARSMYFCVGGPVEVLDGGVHSVENLFTKMETADAIVESRFLRMVAETDKVIVMGTRAVRFFREKGVDTECHVVSGGIDSARFHLAKEPPCFDLILTGRLVPIKRVDVLLQAVKYVVEKVPQVRVVIVGDGQSRDALHALAIDLGIDHNVQFVGHQVNVEDWLRRSRIFVLTSDSEGLPLSVMEAMMCGLPAVVSEVGDLGDLVKDGVNGYLVPRRSSCLFAERIVELLSDKQKLGAFSTAARHSTLRYETVATIKRWDDILASFKKS